MVPKDLGRFVYRVHLYTFQLSDKPALDLGTMSRNSTQILIFIIKSFPNVADSTLMV